MNGARVGITAARRASEQANLVSALGGVPVLGPAIRPDAPSPDADVAPALAELVAEPVDIVVFLTGVGAALLFDCARREGIEDALRRRLAMATVVGRGIKPRRALRALGVEADEVIDPPTVAAVRDSLLPRVAGRRVFVQGFGPEPAELVEPLRSAGARVTAVSPYASTLPDDPSPARVLAAEMVGGSLAAITFTSAQAARQFVAIADAAGIDVAALARARALVVSVGPVTSAALESEGLAVDLEPQTPRMGAMFQALARRLAAEPDGAIGR